MFARCTSLLIFIFCTGPLTAQDPKVYSSLTADQMESILKGLNIQARKSESKQQAGTVYFDFLRGRFNCRLHFYNGKDLMLDTVFPDQPLDAINNWNVRAKFSRVARHKDEKAFYTVLESNLDLVGGVTEGAIKQFFKTFEDDVLTFHSIVGSEEQKPSATVAQDKTETLLKGLNLEYKKGQVKGKDDAFYYDFQSMEFKIRLTNYGGKELMLDAVFKKAPLERINDYNFQRKFIRAVLYNQQGQEYTSLETNLDCTPGVTDNMVRHFILTFDDEVKSFAEFLSKNP